MGKVIASITTSVDGYVTGPDDGPDYGLGKGGERLHYWVMGGPWTYDGGARVRHARARQGVLRRAGLDGLVRHRRPRHVRRGGRLGRDQSVSRATVRAHPPHRGPARPGERASPFVSGLERALAQARAAAGSGDVAVGGGAEVIREALAAGQVDELVISTAPVILGAGKRLFDGFDGDIDLEVGKVYSSPYATHVRDTVTNEPQSRAARRGGYAADRVTASRAPVARSGTSAARADV